MLTIEISQVVLLILANTVYISELDDWFKVNNNNNNNYNYIFREIFSWDKTCLIAKGIQNINCCRLNSVLTPRLCVQSRGKRFVHYSFLVVLFVLRRVFNLLSWGFQILYR